jgi:hypothetical protein
MLKWCVEEPTHLRFTSQTACIVGSQIAAAEWLRLHPNHHVVGIKCRPVGVSI